VPRPKITSALKGSLGEIYYKEFCDQRGWAYISLENLYFMMNDQWIFTFKKGFNRIRVKIPQSVRSEVEAIAQPTNNSTQHPSFVFDFLACRVGTRKKYFPVNYPEELCWVEIKTGKGTFSENQIFAMSQISLKLAIFQIDAILESPFEVHMNYLIKSGKEWLSDFELIEKQLAFKNLDLR
jgi:hypothetical protein